MTETMPPKSEKQSAQQIMRAIRSGSVPMVMDVLDAVSQDGVADENKNTPLHAVLLNPSVNSSAKLLEALVAEFISAGVNPLAQNDEGQTPRQLAETMIMASNISDGQYGALNTVILRLAEVEKQMHPEKSVRRGIPKPEGMSQNESWVQNILRGREQHVAHTR